MTDAVIELGRRERKKLETRRALAHEALRLAAERGPDQVTVEDIADAADVSVRTFFNYFSSKEEAIIGSDHEGRDRIASLLLARPADEPPFVALCNVIHALVGDAPAWLDDRALRQRLVREHPSLLPRHLAALHDLERALTFAMAERLGVDPTASIYPALVVTATVNAMRLALTWWEARGRTEPLPALLEEAFAGLERGLAPPAPRKKK